MIQRGGDSFLHAHAAGGAQGGYYRRCDTCNHLYDELQGFFLTHNVFNRFFSTLGIAKNSQWLIIWHGLHGSLLEKRSSFFIDKAVPLFIKPC